MLFWMGGMNMGLNDLEEVEEAGDGEDLADRVVDVADDEFAAFGGHLLTEDEEETEAGGADVFEMGAIQLDVAVSSLHEGFHVFAELAGVDGIESADESSDKFVVFLSNVKFHDTC